jgi:transcriptional regulator with GAF, ATPase, and Fis domain
MSGEKFSSSLEKSTGISELDKTLFMPQMAEEEIERGHILKALTQTRWLVGGPNGAAALLGLNRTTLVSKMEKLGISRRAKAEG